MPNVNYKFNGYNYIGPADETKTKDDYQFNHKYYDDLISNHQYTAAADYLENFTFEDEDKQNELYNSIDILRNQGRKTEYLYHKAKQSPEGQRSIDGAEFYESFLSGTTDKLSESNEYVRAFRKFKDSFGVDSFRDKSNIKDSATELSITFKPKERSYFGIDRLAADNPANIQAFYDTLGGNAEMLLDAGVQLTQEKDGSTTLRFAKNNRLANRILYATGKIMPNEITGVNLDGTDNFPIIHGYDANGNLTNGKTNNVSKSQRLIIGSAESQRLIVGSSDDSWRSLRSLARLVDSAKSDKHTFFKDTDAENPNMITSTLIYGYLDDDLEAQRQAMLAGTLSTSQYSSNKTEYTRILENKIKGANWESFDIYSDYQNEKDDAHTLIPQKGLAKPYIKDLVLAAMDKNTAAIQIGQDADGQFGLYFTISPQTDTSKDAKDYIKQGSTTVFVPGLLTDEIQKLVNANTRFRAMKEVNDMEHYGYSYTDKFGNLYTTNQELVSQFFKSYGAIRDKDGYVNPIYDKNQIIKAINRDNMITDAIRSIRRKYLNANGNITDYDRLQRDIKKFAIVAGNDMYDLPNLNDYSVFGDSEFTPDSVETEKALQAMLGKYKGSVNSSEYARVEDIYNIYRYIMSALSGYKVEE